ncbi:hypothetical protein H9L39_06890 [Fusarium oxysporum f. sp. albedinis]|nr:hypothetical protein H9L39_06890 [Fusarium oxysporum f. sp. albedinis]
MVSCAIHDLRVIFHASRPGTRPKWTIGPETCWALGRNGDRLVSKRRSTFRLVKRRKTSCVQSCKWLSAAGSRSQKPHGWPSKTPSLQF